MTIARTNPSRNVVVPAKPNISAPTNSANSVNPSADFRSIRPDGIVRAKRGKREWSALVEVKVGDNPLDRDQVDAYHRLAGNEGFGVDAF